VCYSEGVEQEAHNKRKEDSVCQAGEGCLTET